MLVELVFKVVAVVFVPVERLKKAEELAVAAQKRRGRCVVGHSAAAVVIAPAVATSSPFLVVAVLHIAAVAVAMSVEAVGTKGARTQLASKILALAHREMAFVGGHKLFLGFPRAERERRHDIVAGHAAGRAAARDVDLLALGLAPRA